MLRLAISEIMNYMSERGRHRFLRTSLISPVVVQGDERAG